MPGRTERLAEGVFLVGGPDHSDGRDCLVYAVDLGETILVDAGCGPGWPRIRENVAAAGLDPAAIGTLVLTHAHIDHIGGAARAVAETGCRVVAHELDAEAIETADPARTAADWYGVRLERLPVGLRVGGEEHELTFPRGPLRLLHTPGHTPGSLVVVLDTPDGRVLLGQDIHGPFLPAFGSDVAVWRRSMQRLLDLEADVLGEGHFGIYRGKAAVRRFIEGHLAANG